MMIDEATDGAVAQLPVQLVQLQIIWTCASERCGAHVALRIALLRSCLMIEGSCMQPLGNATGISEGAALQEQAGEVQANVARVCFENLSEPARRIDRNVQPDNACAS